MCSNEAATSFRTEHPASIPYGVTLTTNSKLTISTPSEALVATDNAAISTATMTNGSSIMQPFDQYRLHLYNYALQAERLRLVQNYAPLGGPLCPPALAPYSPRWAFPMSLLHHRLQPDEPKPQHSYIGLIAMAILSSADSKLVLSDIYQYILDNYPYFRTRGPGWRNSIRHNLSLNDCFVKAGRSANGKGHYWAIHPANVDDFRKGDFRRRKAQRKVRKHMGLAVDDDGNDSPSPPPMTPPPTTTTLWPTTPLIFPAAFPATISRKRQFDVASLLEPDDNHPDKRFAAAYQHSSGSEEGDDEANVDVVTSSSGSKLEDTSSPRDDRTPAPASIAVDESRYAETAPANPNFNFNASAIGSWGCYPTTAGFPNNNNHQVILEHQQQHQHHHHHQQLMAKAYYEHLSHARTIQIGLYQQWHLQRQNTPEEVTENKIL